VLTAEIHFSIQNAEDFRITTISKLAENEAVEEMNSIALEPSDRELIRSPPVGGDPAITGAYD
jgi:hypothetical protein